MLVCVCVCVCVVIGICYFLNCYCYFVLIVECKKLVGEEVLTASSIASTARAFNNKTLRVVTAPSGQKAVLNAAGEVDTTHYKDNNNTVFAVDHVTLVRFTIYIFILSYLSYLSILFIFFLFLITYC